MRIIGKDIPADQLGTYEVRTSVQAVPCPDGAQLVGDDGTPTATVGGPCYVVVDGDRRDLLSATVFEGLYSETVAPQVDPADAAAPTPAPVAPVAPDQLGTDIDAVDDAALDDEVARLTDDEVARLSAALDARKAAAASTTSAETGSTTTDAGATTETATPSVAALSGDTSTTPTADATGSSTAGP